MYPWAKILLTCVFCISVFFVNTWWGLGVAALGLGVALVLSHVRPTRVFGSLAVVYILAILTIALNGFTPPMGTEASMGGVLWSWSFGVFVMAISGAGVLRGAFFAFRLLLVVWAFMLLGATTSPMALLGTLRQLFRPLKSLGISSDDIALILQIALTFLPLTVQEIQTIRLAQKARGLSMKGKSIAQKMRSWLGVFAGVLAGLFRRADRLALAMDARCFGASDERTSLPYHGNASRARVWFWNGLAILGCLCAIALAIFA